MEEYKMKKLLIVFFVLLITGSAVASADFDVYGKIGMAGWFMRYERFYADTVERTDTIYDTIGSVIDTSFEYRRDRDTIPTNTTIMKPFGSLGIKFKTDRFAGCAEMGLYLNSYANNTFSPATAEYLVFQKRSFFLYVKKFYAEWFLNNYLTFKLGKDDAPTFFLSSNQGFNGGHANTPGVLSTDRYPMFQIAVHNPAKTILGKFAVIKVDTSCLDYNNLSKPQTIYRCETRMPKFEGGFSLNLEKDFLGLNTSIAGGYIKYNTVIIDATVPAKDSKIDVDAWVIGGDFGFKARWVKLSFDIFGGKNVGTYGVSVGDEFGWWRVSDFMRPFFPIHSKDTVRNGWVLEGNFILNVKPTDNLAFELSAGHVRGTHDYKGYDKRWEPTYTWYFMTELKVLEHLYITPEVGQFIYGKHLGFGRYIYGGLNTLVEF